MKKTISLFLALALALSLAACGGQTAQSPAPDGRAGVPGGGRPLSRHHHLLQ